MEEILTLLQDEPFSFLVRELYLQQLPAVVRTQLANTDFASDPRQTANLADQLWFAASQHALTAMPVAAAHTLDYDSTTKETIAGLEIDVVNLAQRTQRRAAFPRPQTNNSNNLCYYHCIYGKSARKCQTPCNFLGNGQAGHQ